ncbi:MAG: hypothetical protein AAB579_03275, partial [Patescibacteria group bacterium]
TASTDLYIQPGQNKNTLLNTGGGNVGIGTITPIQALHIVGQCVTGDTRLRRRRRKKNANGTDAEGYDYDEVQIKDIQAGDEIASLDEQTGMIVWSKVNTLMDMGVKQTYKLTTTDGRTIRTTGNHPYLVQNIGARSVKHPSPIKGAGWLAVDTIKAGDYIAVPRSRGIVTNQKTLMRDQDSLIRWAVDLHHTRVNEPFGFQPTTRLPGFTHQTHRTYQYNSEINKNNTLISEDGVFSPLMSVAPLIETLIGEYSRSANLVKTLVVDNLSEDRREDRVIESEARTQQKAEDFRPSALRSLKRLFGWNATDLETIRQIVKKRDAEANKASKTPKVVDAFDESTTRVFELYTRPNIVSSPSVDNGMAWVRVASIEPVAAEQVYDIEVENTHNFIGNDIVAHNTFISSDLFINGNDINLGTGTATTTIS